MLMSYVFCYIVHHYEYAKMIKQYFLQGSIGLAKKLDSLLFILEGVFILRFILIK